MPILDIENTENIDYAFFKTHNQINQLEKQRARVDSQILFP
jgi:hypothetical protein